MTNKEIIKKNNISYSKLMEFKEILNHMVEEYKTTEEYKKIIKDYYNERK
jgi:hypothetical protein